LHTWPETRPHSPNHLGSGVGRLVVRRERREGRSGVEDGRTKLVERMELVERLELVAGVGEEVGVVREVGIDVDVRVSEGRVQSRVQSRHR
jgi:hypothetical protein